MKMKYIIVIALCALLTPVWYFWNSGHVVKNQEAAFLVPQNAVLFIEQKEMGSLIVNFQKSHLGKTLASIDFQRIGRDIGLPEEELATMQQTLNVIKDLGNSKLFREFCGEGLALALLPVDTSSTVGSAASPTSIQALLIVKPQHKAEIFELISSVYSGDVQQTEIEHGTFILKRFQIEDTAVFVAMVDGFFLLSMDEQTIHRALDVSRQADISLAQNEAYQKLKNQYHTPEFFAFCSLEGLRRQFAERVAQSPPGLQNELAGQLASTVGLQYSAYGIWRDKGLLRDLFITLVDQAKLHPIVGKMLSISPEHNDTLRLVPENILTYYWSNTFALSSMWKLYEEKNKADTTEIDTFKTAFKKTTGREMSEVLALINGGVSLFLKKGDPKAFIPLPHLAVFIKLNNRKAGEDILRKLVAEYGIPLQSNTYKQVAYSSYGLTLQGGLQALYGFHENFLFLANSSEVMQDIIDTLETGKGLQTGETYTRMDINLEEGNNSVSFIQMADLVGGIKELLGWSGTMLAIQNRETAAKSKILIEQLINPLLDGMTMFSTISTRSRLAKEQIVVESTMLLNPAKETP